MDMDYYSLVVLYCANLLCIALFVLFHRRCTFVLLVVALFCLFSLFTMIACSKFPVVVVVVQCTSRGTECDASIPQSMRPCKRHHATTQRYFMGGMRSS